MAKFIVKQSSPENTPEEDIMYVIETPSVDRVKMKKSDVEKHIESIDFQTEQLEILLGSLPAHP